MHSAKYKELSINRGFGEQIGRLWPFGIAIIPPVSVTDQIKKYLDLGNHIVVRLSYHKCIFGVFSHSIGGNMEMRSLLAGSCMHGISERCARVLALTLGILLLSLPVFSQSSMGRILGGVRDQSDASIVGATVVITDVQRGVSRTLVTDGDGEYLAPN